jgi:Clp amino terminal domain, pathogenicity island component
VPEYLKLSLVGQPPLRGAAQARRGFGADGDEREGYQPLRPMRAADEPRRDLPGPVPAAQGGTGNAGIAGCPVERHPVGAFELSVQLKLEFPVVEPVFPVHDGARLSLMASYPINSMVLTWFTGYHTLITMFERFTHRARHVVVLSQEEARQLHHNYIGTEHILLGLLGEPDGLASRALQALGMSLEGTRREVTAIVGTGSGAPSGHIPFTPRAKKTLEFSLREALQLHHNYIGTEHILLGLIREGEGVAAQVLRQHAGLPEIRVAVLDLLPVAGAEAARGRRWLRRGPTAGPGEPGESGAPAEQAVLSATPAADTTLSEAARLAGPQPVGSHHLLLATLADSDSAAARALVALGVDLDQAKEALRGMDVTGTSDEPPEEAGRRQMVIHVTDERLTIEATDPAITEAGRAALRALGDQADPAGAIRGDLPVCASLSTVWQALHDSLEVIERCAAPPDQPPGRPDKPGTEAA